MQDRNGRVQTGADTLHELRRQRDLGHKQEDAKTVRQRSVGGGEIDLRLAAGDDAVEERDRVGRDRVDGGLLLRREVNRLGGAVGGGRHLEQARVSCLAPRGRRSGLPRRPDARRQHGADDLHDRQPVVLGHQLRELDLMRKQKRGVARAGDWLRLYAGVLCPERDHEAVSVAATERHGHPVARYDLKSFRHRIGVGLARDSARGLDGHLGEKGQPYPLTPTLSPMGRGR
jgi:hypothetical protein